MENNNPLKGHSATLTFAPTTCGEILSLIANGASTGASTELAWPDEGVELKIVTEPGLKGVDFVATAQLTAWGAGVSALAATYEALIAAQQRLNQAVAEAHRLFTARERG